MIPDRKQGVVLRIQLAPGGIVAVTDPVHIRVCELLDEGGMRPSDLSSAVGVASSSLHFILDKMMENGVICRHKPDPEKKSVVYRLSSITVLKKTERACTESMDEIVSETRGDEHIAWGSLFDAYFEDSGIESPYLQERYADFLAEFLTRQKGSSGLEDAVFTSKKAVAELTGYAVNVFSLNPLTIIVDGDWHLPSHIKLVASLFSKLVHRLSGSYGSISSVTDIGNGLINRFKITMSNDDDFEVSCIRPEHDSENIRFAVVGRGSQTVTIVNDVQMEILETVYDGPLSVTEIVERSSSPRSTVTSNILKMAEAGILQTIRNDSESASYFLSLPVILKKGSPVSEKGPCHDADDPASARSFMDGYFRFVMNELHALGFDTDMLSEQIGRYYADRSPEARTELDRLASDTGTELKSVEEDRIVMRQGPGLESAMVRGMARYLVDKETGGRIERGSDDLVVERNESYSEDAARDVSTLPRMPAGTRRLPQRPLTTPSWTLP